ncbi:hypothetical protein LTR50_005609 [Elasticomyces elasticus]|nr:hypothetical protein LTR50_005609 [Elasticomyces elasticus]
MEIAQELKSTRYSRRRSPASSIATAVTAAEPSIRRSTRQRFGTGTTDSPKKPDAINTHSSISTTILLAKPSLLFPLPPFRALPTVFKKGAINLSWTELKTLLAKQRRLREPASQAHLFQTIGSRAKDDAEDSSPWTNRHLAQAASATLVFAQEEAGTAVCISASGLLLTCSHCIAEEAADLESNQTKWLLFASGRTVQAQCIAWDPKRDLALLQIIAAQGDESAPPATTTNHDTASFSTANSFGGPYPSISLSPSLPTLHTPLFCIGHPGSFDLESTLPGAKTNYAILHLSTGAYRGLARLQDPHDNAEIGALRHDCWTYWGHSGAPLVEEATGCLVGLHSSWDEETGMRRGVPLVAIERFLRACTVMCGDS